ncbi:MAG: PP2C family protein-serine/threonine phosphatase [Candidatus Latescibacteria bacterium]|nr:PP2C family protein-serine/threonine phosphatase [Candidatus Latescibacterota bacterium]
MLSIDQKCAFLKGTDLFADVPDSDLAKVAAVASEVTYAAHERLFQEGERGDALYLIVQGQVRLLKDDVEVLVRGAGECLGEFALLDDAPRSATVEALTDILALRLTRDEFHQFILDSTVIRGIYKLLTRKLRTDLDVQITTIREQEQVRQDIRRAYEVQMSMLPHTDLQWNEVHISGYCQPAAGVGGDYYDYFLLPQDHLGLLICDVAGHGFYSGLLAAMAKSCLTTQLQTDASVESVMPALNRIVCQTGPDWLLMNVCYILLDARAHTLTYANAGHHAPYHYTSQTKQLHPLRATTFPFGVLQDAVYQSIQRPYRPGDTLILCSDGVMEAMNIHDEMFGEARLERLIMTSVDLPAVELKQTILHHLTAYCQGVPQHDDVTIVVGRI